MSMSRPITHATIEVAYFGKNIYLTDGAPQLEEVPNVIGISCIFLNNIGSIPRPLNLFILIYFSLVCE